MENANWLNKIYANVRKQKIKSCYAFINLVNKIEDAPHIYKVENTNDYFMELDGITFSFRWERKYPVSRIIEEIYSAIQVLTLLKLKEQIIDHDLLSRLFYVTNDELIYYYSNDEIYTYDLNSKKKTILCTIKTETSAINNAIVLKK